MTTYTGRDLWSDVDLQWPTVQLRKVARLGTGHTPSRSHPEYWENCTIPWVTTADLSSRTDGGLRPLLDTEQYISELGVANSAAVVHAADTVMLSRTASIGYVVRIGRPMATTQAFVTWTCGPDLSPRYLLLVLNAMKPEFDRLAYGSTHLTIYFPDIEQLRVPLPPLDTQERIADYLDAETARIDALITKKQRMIELLKERSQAAIDAGVGPFRKTVQVRRLTSELTSGPRGWAELVGEAGDPFLRITNISRNVIDLDMRDTLRVDPPTSLESRRARTQAGDVLVSITADIGSVGVVSEELAGSYFSQHVARVRPTACDPYWLAYAIKSAPAQAQLDSGQYGGTKTQLALGDIAGLRVPDVGVPEQRVAAARIHSTLTRLLGLQKVLNAQIELLREHRQALITAAVTGELEVPGVVA